MELEYSGIGHNKEQSAKLLCHLISQASNLVKPYNEAILKVGVANVAMTICSTVCSLALFCLTQTSMSLCSTSGPLQSTVQK